MIRQEVIGIHYKSNKYMNHLGCLFESINFNNYMWHVSCSENFTSGEYSGKVELFLPNGIYSGKQLLSIIEQTPRYYIHLLRLLIVPVGKSIDTHTINNYNDFLKNDVEVVLLSADSDVDLYVKNPKILKNIMQSCIKYYSTETEDPYFLTLQNDDRSSFWV